MRSVSVVVVTWNARDLTLRCLDSLRDQQTPGRDVELVVVDNASSDDTLASLAGHPDVRVVSLPTNTGFAGGAEAGIAASHGEIVVLVNNDAVAEPGFLTSLVAPFDDPEAHRLGATTGRVLLSGLFSPAGDSPESALVGVDGSRWVRTLTGTRLVNSTGNEVTRSGNGRDRDWLAPADGPAAPAEVFGFNGGCAALSRAALADVGGFEARLFLYYEDTELSWRLRRRGWRVRHVADAVTVHDHAASSGTTSARFLDHNERNRLLVALIHAPWTVVARATARAGARAVLGTGAPPAHEGPARGRSADPVGPAPQGRRGPVRDRAEGRGGLAARPGRSPPMTHVAVTVEQCWQRVPGGSASYLLGLLHALRDQPGVQTTGISAAHRHQPPPDLVPPDPFGPRACPATSSTAPGNTSVCRVPNGRSGMPTWSTRRPGPSRRPGGRSS